MNSEELRGKKVICVYVTTECIGILTLGKVYTILEFNAACFKVRNDSNRRRYHAKDQFRLIKEITNDIPI